MYLRSAPRKAPRAYRPPSDATFVSSRVEAAFPTTNRCLTFHVAPRTPHPGSHPDVIVAGRSPEDERHSRLIRFARSNVGQPLFRGQPAAAPERLTPSIRPEESSSSVQLRNPPGRGSSEAPVPFSPESSANIRTNEVVRILSD
jgi:hypothetical protein